MTTGPIKRNKKIVQFRSNISHPSNRTMIVRAHSRSLIALRKGDSGAATLSKTVVDRDTCLIF